METCKTCVYLVVDQCHRNPPQQLTPNSLAVYPLVKIDALGCGERITAEELAEAEKEPAPVSMAGPSAAGARINKVRSDRLKR